MVVMVQFKLIVLAVVVLGPLVGAKFESFSALADSEWEAFKATYGKKYDSLSEEQFRREIYFRNRMEIAEHNKQGSSSSYSMEMNEFGDQLPEEFLMSHTGLEVPDNDTLLQMEYEAVPFFPGPYATIPNHVDWRERGHVTPVKNQGSCGSCWAFAATGALEAQMFKKTGKLTGLSEQNLVDCSRSQGNAGCRGGWPSRAFQYVEVNNGISTEQAYPYQGIDGPCRYNPRFRGGTCRGFGKVKGGDENLLKTAVATVGPVTVAINVPRSFQLYKRGVYYDRTCKPNSFQHAVLVVGYGSENGQDYWLVKNSWGSNWGEEGYIRMARNRDNHCGIASIATYPIV